MGKHEADLINATIPIDTVLPLSFVGSVGGTTVAVFGLFFSRLFSIHSYDFSRKKMDDALADRRTGDRMRIRFKVECFCVS